MKGILLFDHLSDLAFLDVDEELCKHIEKLAFKDGLLEILSFKNNEGIIDKNVVMQLFSPLIASFKVMQGQFGNNYKYIETEDGALLVFKEIFNYTAISICGKEEKVHEIEKELLLLTMIVEMLFGPSLYMIKDDIQTCCKNISRSDLLIFILKKWRILKMEQQMYLVEAIERVVVNQDITATCINLLQEILEKMRSSQSDGTFTHAFALVDTKLLALYSSRNAGQLAKEVLLLLIIIAEVLKHSHKENDASVQNHSSDDEFFIPISLNILKIPDNKGNTKPKKDYKNVSSATEAKDCSLQKSVHSVLLYMKSRSGNLVPQILHVVEITSKITLVLVNELTSHATMSSNISNLVKEFNNLLLHPLARRPLGSFEHLEKDFKNLVDSIWKLKSLKDKEKHIKKLIAKWEQLKSYAIHMLYASPKIGIDHKLESSLSSCTDLLKNLFEEIIAVPSLKYEGKSFSGEYQELLKYLQKLCRKRLHDIADFLEVKAVQNITMASYISEYPGLVHFIYVDRSCDSLIAPAVILKKGHLSGITSIKHKVWRMVLTGRRYIDGCNNFCCLWKDEDLNYFYHIWFEDSMGRRLKPISIPNLKYFPKKGIICGNFYKMLVEECFPGAAYNHIQCYEFFSMHLGSTPTETIVDHSRKLSAQLWDFTGAYRNSLDLL